MARQPTSWNAVRSVSIAMDKSVGSSCIRWKCVFLRGRGEKGLLVDASRNVTKQKTKESVF